VASFLLVLVSHANAATINIDLTGLGTTETFTPNCYCSQETLYISPIYNLPAGDTYNFGTLSLRPFSFRAGAATALASCLSRQPAQCRRDVRGASAAGAG